MDILLDIGGEGRHPRAWNLNPSRVKTVGANLGAPIPRLIVGRADAIPLRNGSVRTIISERTPLTARALHEIVRVLAPGGEVVLRHAAMPGRDPHRLAKAIFGGVVRQRAVRIGSRTVQETRIRVGRLGQPDRQSRETACRPRRADRHVDASSEFATKSRRNRTSRFCAYSSILLFRRVDRLVGWAACSDPGMRDGVPGAWRTIPPGISTSSQKGATNVLACAELANVCGFARSQIRFEVPRAPVPAANGPINYGFFGQSARKLASAPLGILFANWLVDARLQPEKSP